MAAELPRARGECPNCRMPIPFGKTMMGRGKSFTCKGCGAQLRLPIMLAAVAGLAAVGLVVLKLAGAIAVLPVLVAIGAYDWLTATVELVEQPPA